MCKAYALLRLKKVESKIFGLNQNILILAQMLFWVHRRTGHKSTAMFIGYCYIGKGFLINFFTFLDQKVQSTLGPIIFYKVVFFFLRKYLFFHSLEKDWIKIIYLI